jgi:NADH-quinone oxidoreductase subunit N
MHHVWRIELILDNIVSLKYFYPEASLIGAILVLVVLDLVFKERREHWQAYVALAGLAPALVFAIKLYAGGESGALFTEMLALDPFAGFFRIFFIAATGLTIIISTWSSDTSGRENRGEYYAFLLMVTLGMFLLASSMDLLMIYLSLELVSITSYVLAGFLKGVRRSSEAALKYVIYGAVASGIMIYGMSLIYGLTGSTNLMEIRNALSMAPPSTGFALFVAVLFVLAGFGYKIATVPFHMWSPDVYEGAPTPITAFLSVGPKAAGFAVLIRFFYMAMTASGPEGGLWVPVSDIGWPMLLGLLSAGTMTAGNLIAINQSNVKRLLAYSSIAHAGYILMGFVLLSAEGLKAMLFYLVVYLIMNMGAFLVVILVANKLNSEEISDYEGLGWRAPFLAAAMTVFLFSLTGIPPTAGFIGKFYLFAAIFGKEEFYWLAIVGILNSVVSLYYYARIVKAMFLSGDKEQTRLTISPYHTALLGVLVAPTILFGLYWAPLWEFVARSLKFLAYTF